MSATTRDTAPFKAEPENASDTPVTDRSTPQRCETIETEPTNAPLGIVATLCRMALLRSRSTSVSGAYQRDPLCVLGPETPDV